MAAAGSLKPFYIGLGIMAVAGGALIASRSMGSGRKPPSLAPSSAPVVASGPRGIVKGSDSARVEVMEFADFECPWCARFAVLTLPDLERRLVETGRVRWRFVHHIIEGHRDSPLAHLAAACAQDQGKFWVMHDAIYNAQSDWVGARRPESVLNGIAQRAGLDMSRYGTCMDGRTAWNQVLADQHFSDSLGVTGTPTFFINGRMLQGGTPSFDQFMHIIDSIAPVAAAPAGAPPR